MSHTTVRSSHEEAGSITVVFVSKIDHSFLDFKIGPQTHIGKYFDKYKEIKKLDHARFTKMGQELDPTKTVGELGLENGDHVAVHH